AEPYAHLAALRIRQGFSAEAVALQAQAVKHAPDDAANTERLAAYQALADSERPPAVPRTPPPAATGDSRVAPTAADPLGDWPDRLSSFDCDRLADRLTRDGC